MDDNLQNDNSLDDALEESRLQPLTGSAGNSSLAEDNDRPAADPSDITTDKLPPDHPRYDGEFDSSEAYDSGSEDAASHN